MVDDKILTLEEVLHKLDNSTPENERPIMWPPPSEEPKPSPKFIHKYILEYKSYYEGEYEIDEFISDIKKLKKKGANHVSLQLGEYGSSFVIRGVKKRMETDAEFRERIKTEEQEKLQAEKDAEKYQYDLYQKLKKKFDPK
jgi:hypothetical protein